jgi:hypothetical protein
VDQHENRIALSPSASPPECVVPSHRQEYAAGALSSWRVSGPGRCRGPTAWRDHREFWPRRSRPTPSSSIPSAQMRNDEKERELQKRILESPSLLPGFNEPAAATKEVAVRRAGSADVVVVDAEGQIAIVECKRATNPECRRCVIGQVFEYAAGLWKLGYSDFERILAARGTILTKPFKGAAGWDEETFRRVRLPNPGSR